MSCVSPDPRTATLAVLLVLGLGNGDSLPRTAGGAIHTTTS